MSHPQGSVDEMAAWLRKHAATEATLGEVAVFAFEITGVGGGVIRACVDDGAIDIDTVPAPEADVRFRMSRKDCLGLMAGTENAELLALEGRLEVSGDLSLAVKVRRFFRRADPMPNVAAG